MENIVVLYKSKYGATKKYAEWLAEELSSDIIETKQAGIEQVAKYDTIILGGGIYATGIAGISFLRKHYEKLKDKRILVFAVGASPYDEKAMTAIKERNFNVVVLGMRKVCLGKTKPFVIFLKKLLQKKILTITNLGKLH